MSKKIYISLTGMLALLLPLGAQADNKPFEGSIELTPTYADVSGNEAKFNEYRDIDKGLYGNLDLRAETGRFFFNLEADDILYDTQRYQIDGGTYGKYRFNLFYNEIPHNLTFDARTPMTGAGTGTLTFNGAGTLNTIKPAVSSWNTFDYSVERRQGGGGLRLNMVKPFYLDVSFNQENREGIKPTGTSWNAASGGGSRRVLEMPEPVDYVTNNVITEVGYSLNPFFGAISYAHSEFDNDNKFLMYEHPNTNGTMEALSLPPDNEYSNLAFKGRAILPCSSALSLKAERGNAKTSTLLRQQYLSDVGAVTPINLSDNIFDGKVTTTSYDVALTSSPVSFASGRVFYKYHEKDNKSDHITTTDGSDVFSNHLFGYDKDTFGAGIDFKLPAHFKVKPSYQRVNVERHRGDFPETTDNVYAIDGQWQGVDWLGIKAGYEILDRDSPWQLLTSVVPDDQSDANAIEPYLRRFDLAPQDRKTYSLGLDITPSEGITFGLGYKNRNVSYDNPFVGLREEESQTYDFSIDYALQTAKFGAYFAYEQADQYQFQRRITSTANTNPALGFNATSNYNWSVAEETKNWDYGVTAELEVVPDKWRIKAQYDRSRSNGLANFALYDNATITGFTNDTLDIMNYDDYKKNSLSLKAIYNMNKHITTTFGYAFERYTFSDAHFDLYQYNFNTNDFLSGAHKDPNFEANVLFCSVKYSF